VIRYADTFARYVDLRGHILDPWEDVPEEAIPVRTLGAYARTWREEPEAPRDAPVVVEPRYGAVQVAVVRYLREHGEAQATDIARSITIGNLAAIRSRLCAMEREGKLVRVGKGRYRLA